MRRQLDRLEAWIDGAAVPPIKIEPFAPLKDVATTVYCRAVADGTLKPGKPAHVTVHERKSFGRGVFHEFDVVVSASVKT
jgi:hypothetical protein